MEEMRDHLRKEWERVRQNANGMYICVNASMRDKSTTTTTK